MNQERQIDTVGWLGGLVQSNDRRSLGRVQIYRWTYRLLGQHGDAIAATGARQIFSVG
jgi:hypothetical protein